MPAKVTKHHEFDVTTRVHSMGPKIKVKRSGKKTHRNIESRTSADFKNDAYRAISMIENLKQREKEIAIEEKEFTERKLSEKVTFIHDFAASPKFGKDMMKERLNQTA